MSHEPVRVFSRFAARSADREAIEEWGIPGAVLMENAARAVARVAGALLKGPSRRVLIVAGSGGNGGDGWAAARWLMHAGTHVRIAELGEPAKGSDAEIYRSVARRMGAEIIDPRLPPARAEDDLIIDAMFGTGLARPAEGLAARWMEAINASGVPVLSVDIPSGMDAETGAPLASAIRATGTVTFLGPKPGFLLPGAAAFTGWWLVSDIGMPIEIRRRHGRIAPECNRADGVPPIVADGA